ncbi:hypothetical protein HY218_00255, partial [Candidatus Saccharibacteria bacterium]|nr:hypothetical protein [Candidatus Saccharibacteria bacterium]
KTQARTAARIKQEVWQDKALQADRKRSLSELAKLPGEYVPALVRLQKRLALRSLAKLDLGLFFYFVKDIMKFRLKP